MAKEIAYYVDANGNYYVDSNQMNYIAEIAEVIHFYKHKAYIKGKPYIAFIYQNGAFKRARPFLYINPVVLETADGTMLLTSDGKEFKVYARNTALLGDKN